MTEFYSALQNRRLEKILRFIPEQIEDVKVHALTNVYKNKLDELEPSTQALVHDMMDYMAKKCVAVPMKLAKRK